MFLSSWLGSLQQGLRVSQRSRFPGRRSGRGRNGIRVAEILEPRTLLAADPLLASWLEGSLGENATIIDPANVVAGPKTTWTGQSTPVPGDIHKISSSATYVYVEAPELASYLMGPWFLDVADTQPSTNYPTDQDAIYRFDRTPTPAALGSHVTTQQLTPIGLLVNGVPIFNQQDGFSYKNGLGTDVTGGDRYWHRNAAVSEQVTFDHANGHASINGTQYHVHVNPEALRAQLNDNIFYSGPGSPDYFPYDTVATQADADADFYDEATASLQHSPIIGWALDGYPIYGPYGYSDALDSGSPIERLDSSYRLRNITTRTSLPGFAAMAKFGDNVTLDINGEYPLVASLHGPAVSPQFPLGHYIEDFEYVSGLGDLDVYNSRFAVTPEFPAGTQAYFVTIDAFGNPAFPYTIGRQFFGQVTSGKVSQIFETVTVSFDIINTPPTFTNIPDQCVYTNHVIGPLSYHLTDTQTLPGNLMVEVTSSNTTLVPLSNIEMVGSGITRTIKVTPATNINGTSLITLTATDEFGKSSSESFLVTVTSGLNPPTLDPLIPAVGAIPPVPKVVVEDSGQHALTLSGITDADCGLQELRVTATTSDPNLIHDLSVAYTSNMTTGTVFFKTAANAAGTANLYVTVEDGGYDGLLSTSADNKTFSRAIQVIVDQTPDAPTMNPFSPNPLGVIEDSAPVTVTFTGISDGDDGTQELMITASSSDTNLIPNPTISYTSPNTSGTMTFQPVAQMSGEAIITVYITDGGTDGLLATPGDNLTTQKQLTVHVLPINDLPRVDPPPAMLNVSENSGGAAPTVITLTGIDSGPFEDQLMYLTVSSNNTALVPTPTWNFTAPTPGVPMSGSATITFTPVANKSGTATLRIKLIDAGLDNNLQITSDNGVTEKPIVVKVDPVNDPPTLNPIPAITIKQGATFDPTTTLNTAIGTASQNQISVLHASKFPTNVPFFIKVNNEQMKVTAINGNQFTVARGQNGTQATTHAPGRPVSMLPILSGITAGGGEQQHMKVTAAVQSSTVPGLIQLMNPTVNYFSPDSTGTLEFTAGAGLFGTAVIRVTVEDDGVDGVLSTTGDNATTFQDFTVTVMNVDDLPTLDDLGPVTLYEDGATGNTITVGGISDGDLNSQQIQVTAVSSNTGLVPNPTVNFTQSGVTPSTALQSATLTFNGLAPEQSGTTQIYVTVTDGGADGLLSTTGDNRSVTKSFTLTIANFNDLPTLDPLSPINLNEGDGMQTIPLSGITAGDSETQALTVTAVASVPAAFSALNVTYVSPNAGGTLTFTPHPDAAGTFTIYVTVRDAGFDGVPGNSDDASFTQPLTVTIANLDNDAPTLASFNPSVITIPINSGSMVVPLSGIADGAFENGPVTITVNSDNTGLIPTPTFTHSPATSSAGSLTFTPVAGQAGSAFITVTVTDGGTDHDTGTPGDGELSVNQVFKINVVSPPVLDGISNPLPINEDAATQFVTLTGIGPGPGDAGQPVKVTATVITNPWLLENLSVSYTNPDTTASLSYNPVAHRYGTAFVEVTVTDAGPDNLLSTTEDNSSTTQTFAVAVLPVNDHPSFDPIGPITLQENAPAFTLMPSGASAGPFETNQPYRITGTLIGASGIVTVSPGATPGSVKLTPVPHASGSTQVTVTIEDGGPDLNLLSSYDNLTYSETINVTVDAVNDAPTLAPINHVTVKEDAPETSIVLTGIGAGIDEFQTLTLTASSSDPLKVPDPIIDYIPGSSVATLRFMPNSDATGTVQITVTVTDDNSILTDPTPKQVQRTFNITMTPVNDQPAFDIFQPTVFNLDENAAAGTSVFTIGVTDIDSPPDQILLSIIGGNVSNAFKIENGVVKVNTPAALNFEVNPWISFTVKATNPGSLLPPDIKTFTVNLNDLNETIVVGANNWGVGTSGLIVRRDGGQIHVLNATTGLDVVPAHDETKVDAIQVTGRPNTSDILALDHIGGDVVPTGGISFNGQPGSGTDELKIRNAFLLQLDATFTGAGAGTLDDPLTADAVVTLTGVEAISLEPTNTIISSLNVLMSNGNDTVTLADDGNALNGLMKLTSTTSPALIFAVNVPAITIDLGEGDDVLTMPSADSLLGIPMYVLGNLGNDRLQSSAASPVVFSGDDGNDSLIGGSGNDNLFGGADDDILSGGLGDDFLDGGTETDTLYESADVHFTLGPNTLDGVGSDSFTDIEQAHLVGGSSGNLIDASGFNGSATLSGGGAADTIYGGSGDDVLIGGDGDDQLDGLGGVNTISESGNFNFALNDTTLTGRGTDTYTNISSAWLIGGVGNNSIVIDASFGGNATLDGGGGNDTLVGSEQDDELLGGDGNDVIDGRAGYDTIYGGAGNDSLNGGDDDDTVFGEAGNDTLSGAGGTNDLDGGDHDDQVCEMGDFDMEFLSATLLHLAGVGFDILTSIESVKLVGGDSDNRLDATNFDGKVTLQGGGGDDSLIGGPKSDSLDGGSGSDVLSSGPDQGATAATSGNDTLNGGAGTDTVYESDANKLSILVSGSGSRQKITMVGRGTDLLVGIEAATFIGTSGNDSLNGGKFAGPMFIDGGDGIDTLTGGNGNDTILGGGDGDVLNGAGGNDSIRGGDGNDKLIGGAGNDSMLGDIGDDTLFGQAGNDKLVGGDGADSLAGGVGNDSLTGLAGNDILKGEAGSDVLFGGTENDSILGGAGNDTLLGEEGNDTLRGEAGADVLFDPFGTNVLDGLTSEKPTAFAIDFNAIFGELLGP